MKVGLLAHPARVAHRVDQLGGAARERGCVGDTFAPLVSFPTGAGHPEMIADALRMPRWKSVSRHPQGAMLVTRAARGS